jgi:hypothetical protein
MARQVCLFHALPPSHNNQVNAAIDSVPCIQQPKPRCNPANKIGAPLNLGGIDPFIATRILAIEPE